MRAMVASAYGGSEVLSSQEVARPVPAPDQFLIKVAACGVCGHDLLARTGAFPLSKPPFVMGHEIAGVVAEVGALVKGFKPGDRVAVTQRISCGSCAPCRAGRDNVCMSGAGFYGEAISGGYGDFVVASPRNAVHVPEQIPLHVAALLSCAIGTGFHALRRASLALGDTVVVTGASGGVGIHTVKLASLMGVKVIAISSNSGKVQMLQQAGASHVITPVADFSFHQQVRELTNGEGADAVMEITGKPTFRSSMRSVRPGGRVVLIGNVDPGTVPLNPAWSILREVDLLGSGHATLEDLRRVVDMVASGLISPIIGATLPRIAVAEAHQLLEARTTAGRVVLLHEG